MSVGNRIRALRRSLNLSQPQLAKLAGVGQSTISDLENDKKGTSADKLDSIAEVLSTSSKFLLTGIQDSTSLDANQKTVFEVKKQIIHEKKLLEDNEVVIKYFDELPISCGVGSFGEILEKDAKQLTISAQPLKDRNINKNNCIALPAIGNSMFPTIKDKDTVYIDISRTTIKDGKVFAIFHGGLFKFKRLYQLPMGGVRIVSDNAIEYPEEKLTAQEIMDQQFEIFGWAWSWQSMENW